MKELLRRAIFYKDVSDIITLFATLVLGSVMLVVVFSLTVGLFTPRIDEKEIFNLISPAFQTIVGAFVGLISGIHLGKKEDSAKQKAALEAEQAKAATANNIKIEQPTPPTV